MRKNNAKFQKILKKILRFFIAGSLLFSGGGVFSQSSSFYINVNTIATPPVNPVISQYIMSGSVHCTFTSMSANYPMAYVVGRIERISPSPFTITMNSNFRLDPASQIRMTQGVPVTLTVAQMLGAFGQFNEQLLDPQGIDISSIKDANNNIKLPEGTYRLCFRATDIGPNHEPISNFSNPDLGCATFTISPAQPSNAVIINTLLVPPANPDIIQLITRGNVKPTLLYNNPRGVPARVKVYGKIESLSPKPFTISIAPSYFQQQSISLTPSLPVQLTPQQVQDAFGNFNEANLVTSGINLSDLKDNKNILKLPEGLYRICFYARYDSAGYQGGYASNINLGCTNFSICYKASAPQFTQPVSNFNIQNNIPSVRPASPQIFTWTPPNATCGLDLSQITYDFEIREMFPSQTITDAINNPPVFQKTSLRSSVFILDTLLYRQVLQRGKLYVIRVKANTPLNSPIDIDNNGFSRVQAFLYGDTSSVAPVEVKPELPKTPTKPGIVTSTIKGKVVWSFKKAEEEMPPTIDNSGNTRQVGKFNQNSKGQKNEGGGLVQKEELKRAIDPNLRISALQTNEINSISATPESTLLAVVAGDGETVEKKDLHIASEKGKITHPLVGVKVLLMGVKDKSIPPSMIRVSTEQTRSFSPVSLSTQLGIVGSGTSTMTKSSKIVSMMNIPTSYKMTKESDQDEDIIGSGTTDAVGNFVINFIDPKFKNINRYSSMRVVIEHEDFERHSQYIKVVSPDEDGNVDLGTLQVVAKTYRFTPYVKGYGNQKIEVYYPSGAFNRNPHYAFMVSKNSDKSKKTIAGKEYIKIAELKDGETINKLFYQNGGVDNFIIQIKEKGKEDYSSYMGVKPLMYSRTNPIGGNAPRGVDESQMVISIKKKYTLKRILPFITGNVKILAEDKKNAGNTQMFYAEGAIVSVTYDPTKVVEKYEDIVHGTGGDLSESPDKGISKTSEITKPVRAKKQVSPVVIKNNQVSKSEISKPVVTNRLNPGNKNASSGSVSELSGMTATKVNSAIAGEIFKLMFHSTSTDADGNFRIDNLPVLQDGYFFTVTVKTKENLDTSKIASLTLKRGDSAEMNFQFSPEMFTVTGIAVDENSVPLQNAILKWKSGGNPIEAQPSGLFITSNYKDDSITISNQGYVSKTIFIKLNKEKGNKKGDKINNRIKVSVVKSGILDYDTKKIGAWATTLSTQPSVKAATQQGQTISSAMFGYAVSNPSENVNKFSAKLSPVYENLFMPGLNAQEFMDVGKVGYLVKGFAKINFVVTDTKAKSGIDKAIIIIDEIFDTVTNSSGEVQYKGGGNSFTYSVKGPDGSDYITQSGEVGPKPVDGSITTINISLSHGIKLSGKITSKSKNIEDATIFVDGKAFISTESKSDGTYMLYIPEGESTIKVTKENYYGNKVTKNFTAASVENFELEDGGGKNISKLLGFDIVLESSSDDGTGQKWTGSFVNLKSSALFSATPNTKLKFTNVKVTFDASGNALVSGDKVETDATELSMKMFGFIPIKMKGSPLVTVRKNPDGKGSIGGKLQINFDQISSIGGLLFDNSLKPLLVPANSLVDKDVPVFLSDGSSAGLGNFVFSYARDDLKKAADKAVADFQGKVNSASGDAKTALQDKLNELKSAASSAASYASGNSNIPVTLSQYISVKVYGFVAGIDLAKCKIDASGIDMSGFLLSPDLPILSSMFFDIDKLKVGTDFSVKNISIKSDIHKKFSIANWSAEVNSVAFNMNGFKIGGKIEVQVPQSPKSELAFSNLSFGASGLYGGAFSLPSDGLNIFNIIKLQTGSTPLSFGQVGNSGVYRVGGSAKFSFGKLFSETIDVPFFQVQTDGKFAVTVPVNKSLDAGFAKFALNSITFNTTTSTPQIDIDGQFSVDVKMISFKAGGIHFRNSGVTVDKVALGIDIPGTKVDGYVDIKENGFAGGGSLSIVGTPVKVSIDFHYFKSHGSVDLGANFVANVKIPLGPVIITKVGGGFTYRSKSEFFSVTITGGASITGFESLVALDPISITVESGPKIVGEAHLKLASSFDVAKAFIVIDIPNSYFAVGIVSDIEPLPDIIKAHVEGELILSTKPGDSYFFFGAGMDVNLLGLIQSRGVFAIGFGVNDAQTRESISYFMHDAPSEYLSNGSFTGIYLRASSEIGVKENDAPELDLGIISGKLWLYTKSDFSLIANFTNGNFRIGASMYFEGGIQGCVIGICASASAKACVGIAGGYSDSQGWNFEARASGEAKLHLGDDCDCNSICGPIWPGASICIGAGAKIKFASRQGGLKEFSMFIGDKAKCN